MEPYRMKNQKEWEACCRASNRIADIVMAVYVVDDGGDRYMQRKVMPTSTWAEIIAEELKIELDKEES